jgi:hypothetical protein
MMGEALKRPGTSPFFLFFVIVWLSRFKNSLRRFGRPRGYFAGLGFEAIEEKLKKVK